MLLPEGVVAYKKGGPKFIQRLVAKQKLRTTKVTIALLDCFSSVDAANAQI